MNARSGCPLAVLVALCVTPPLVAQSSDSIGTVTNAVRFSVPLSQVENWERAVERVADDGDARGNAWRMYQTELSGYLLFAFGDPGRQSRVVDGFVGAPGGQPTDGVVAPLREVRYDVAQHDVWRLVAEWSTREEIDPAAFIEDDRHHDVMVMVYDPAGPGGFMTEHGAAHRWQALMRDVARVITAHTTVRARLLPALSVAPLR